MKDKPCTMELTIPMGNTKTKTNKTRRKQSKVGVSLHFILSSIVTCPKFLLDRHESHQMG